MGKPKNKMIVMLITVLLFFAMFIGNYGQYQLSAIPGVIYQTFHLTDIPFSSVMTAPMVPTIFLSIIMGIIADKCGLNKLISVCFIASSAGFILRCTATNYTMIFIAMALTGLGCAVLNSNMAKIVASLYPIEQVGRVIGILMAGSTGAMAVAYATTSLIPSIEMVFWIAAIASIVVTAGWLLLARETYFTDENAPAEESIPLKESILASLKSKNIWLTGFSLMLMLGGSMITTNFQITALTTLKGYSETYAGSFGTALMIGAILGSIFLPPVILGSKKAPLLLLLSGLSAALSMIAIPLGSAILIYIGSFANGFLRSGIISVMMTLPVMFPEIGPRYAGTAGGLAVTMELIGAVVIPTYIIVPLGSGNLIAYFMLGALCTAVSAVLCSTASRVLTK